MDGEKSKEHKEIVEKLAKVEREIDEYGKENEILIKEKRSKENNINNLKKANQEKEIELKALQKEVEQLNEMKIGGSGGSKEFALNFDEAVNFIPETPLQGIETIHDYLEKLKGYIEKNSNKKKQEEAPQTKKITINYSSQGFRLLTGDDPRFTFYNVLEESCLYFDCDINHFILKDDSEAIWPLDTSVYDFQQNNKKGDLVLFLSLKNSKSSKQSIVIENDSEADPTQVAIDAITKVLTEEEKKMNSTEHSNDFAKDSVFTPEEKQTLKQTKENVTVLEIQKTFSSTFIHLVVYVIILYIFLKFKSVNNDTEFTYQLKKLVQEKFMMEDFPFSFTLYDYFTRNQENNYSINNYTNYKISTNLQEIQEYTQIFEWINQYFFDKLGFKMKPDMNKKSFLSKYPLIGKMRFLQLRQQLENIDSNSTDACAPYSVYSDNYTETKRTYCYLDYKKNQNDSSAFFNFNDNMQIPKDLSFRDSCKNNMSFAQECLIMDGFTYRPISETYSYTGSLTTYKIDGGFYFDLPLVRNDTSKDTMDYTKIMEFLKHYWTDLSTRLVMVSFNALETSNLQTLFCINLYIEQGGTGILIKNFDINIFKAFINLNSDPTVAGSGEFISDLLVNYSTETFYLVTLLFYALLSTISLLQQLCVEGFIIFKKNSIQVSFQVAIIVAFYTILVFRVYTTIRQNQAIANYSKNQFLDYFPVNHLVEPEDTIKSIEMITSFILIVNIFNVFYYQFFEQIFLVFREAGRKLLSFVLVYGMFVLAYAVICSYLFGPYVKGFEDLTVSIFSVLYFESLDMDVFKVMTEKFFIAKIIILTYLCLSYFIFMNIIFAVFNDSYNYVKRHNVHTLMYYSTVWNGFVIFIGNYYNKFKDFFMKLV